MKQLLLISTILTLVAACNDNSSMDKALHYQCDSGVTIKAAYDNSAASTAIVWYQDKQHKLTQTRAASGAKYTDGELVWWTKGSGAGSEGTLLRQNQKQTDTILETCRQQ